MSDEEKRLYYKALILLYVGGSVNKELMPEIISKELDRMVTEDKLSLKSNQFYVVNPKKRHFKDIIEAKFIEKRDSLKGRS